MRTDLGATKAWAPVAQARAIAADFILDIVEGKKKGSYVEQMVRGETESVTGGSAAERRFVMILTKDLDLKNEKKKSGK